jgi:hypothetical protein
VTIAVDDGEATLTCATSGATIFYTLDGTYPGSGNSAAVEYSAPFAVSSGQRIRTSAEKKADGYLGSRISTELIS